MRLVSGRADRVAHRVQHGQLFGVLRGEHLQLARQCRVLRGGQRSVEVRQRCRGLNLTDRSLDDRKPVPRWLRPSGLPRDPVRSGLIDPRATTWASGHTSCVLRALRRWINRT